MQPITQHICQAGTAQIDLELIFKESIIGIADDCSIGPLCDVDTSRPKHRAAFWNDLFEQIYNNFNFDWAVTLYNIYQQFSTIGRGTDEVIIWSGTHPIEQLLRRRSYWWLRNVPVKVTEVLFNDDDIANIAGKSYVAVAQIPRELKELRFSERISIPVELRSRLADEWEILRDNGIGIRQLDKNGHLTENSIEYYDMVLQSLVGNQPILFSHAIGMAMVKTHMSDNFCKWRYMEIINKGGLLLSPGTPNKTSCAVICKKTFLS
ncbi:TPA: DUF1835 domain-containing protein [Serratia liquefaciens]